MREIGMKSMGWSNRLWRKQYLGSMVFSSIARVTCFTLPLPKALQNAEIKLLNFFKSRTSDYCKMAANVL